MKTSPLLRPVFTFIALLGGCLVLTANSAFAEVPAGNWPSDAIEGTWERLQTKGFAEGDTLIALLNDATAHPETDLALAKLTLDKLIDPSIDIEANLMTIAGMVAKIESMLPNPARATDNEKMDALRKYIYDAGAWNNNHPFSYDLNDPVGKNIKNKLLPTYLATHKGNCVSMPILFTILGQRMRLDVTLTTAPSHVLMIYTDRASKTSMYVETTSGGYPAREVWLKQVYPSMTDAAIQNGMYLKRLNKVEAVSVMAQTEGEYLSSQRLYKKTIIFSEILLKAYPQNPDSLLRIGTSMGRLSTVEFPMVYMDRKHINLTGLNHEQKRYFNYLYQGNQGYFAKAESLGWRQETEEEKQDYLNSIKQTKAQIN